MLSSAQARRRACVICPDMLPACWIRERFLQTSISVNQRESCGSASGSAKCTRGDDGGGALRHSSHGQHRWSAWRVVGYSCGCVAQTTAETLAGMVIAWLVDPARAVFGPRPMITIYGPTPAGSGENRRVNGCVYADGAALRLSVIYHYGRY